MTFYRVEHTYTYTHIFCFSLLLGCSLLLLHCTMVGSFILWLEIILQYSSIF